MGWKKRWDYALFKAAWKSAIPQTGSLRYRRKQVYLHVPKSAWKSKAARGSHTTRRWTRAMRLKRKAGFGTAPKPAEAHLLANKSQCPADMPHGMFGPIFWAKIRRICKHTRKFLCKPSHLAWHKPRGSSCSSHSKLRAGNAGSCDSGPKFSATASFYVVDGGTP